MDPVTSYEIAPAGCAMASSCHSVMISSTNVELKEHRAAVSQGALGLDMHPLDMGNDAALAKDPITASLERVDKADACIGLIGYHSGQIVEDPRSPDKFSLTEPEFRHAPKRGLPRCMFIMADNYTPGLPRSLVLKEAATLDELTAFIDLARKGNPTRLPLRLSSRTMVDASPRSTSAGPAHTRCLPPVTPAPHTMPPTPWGSAHIPIRSIFCSGSRLSSYFVLGAVAAAP
jgi:hypothetical protein